MKLLTLLAASGDLSRITPDGRTVECPLKHTAVKANISGPMATVTVCQDFNFRAHLNEGESSTGVFLVSQFAAIGSGVEAIAIVWAVSDAGEWWNQMVHLPSMSSHYFSGNKSR